MRQGLSHKRPTTWSEDHRQPATNIGRHRVDRRRQYSGRQGREIDDAKLTVISVRDDDEEAAQERVPAAEKEQTAKSKIDEEATTRASTTCRRGGADC